MERDGSLQQELGLFPVSAGAGRPCAEMYLEAR